MRLFVAGVAISVLALWVGGRLGPGDLGSLHAALAEQTTVGLVRAGDYSPDWILVDGRTPEAHGKERPAGSINVPFASRNRELFPVPDGRPVDVVVVIMDTGEEAHARELALWVARQWGVERVCTYVGGWTAWKSLGFPIERAP